MTSPLGDLDPVLTPPKRLAALAVLRNATTTDFTFLRDHLAVSDSDLSKQMAALVDARYVSVTKSRGRGGSTTYKITGDGKKAFEAHKRALERLIAG
ncbi:transcriptional regulator [Gordonia sp. PDNC005]|uniref:transcriptional regulator n=1 Tax=unclassified Gordonia (in: high G+C Gram-positive bacteria) TaxID=2657482 RepID=UPI0019627467|nr:transcriptional regulator [Gordonia sp. PDNC005]QRY63357.1 transcriptional regulator [Gordonia sp. PDNC005]